MERSDFEIDDLTIYNLRTDILERFKDIMRLVRWGNLLFLGALMWVMEKWVVVPVLYAQPFGLPEVLPDLILWLLIVATVLVAAGGYVINDYFDIKIDRINRPDKVIVSETMTKPAAMRLSIGMSAAGAVIGLLTAFMVRSWPIGIIFILVPGLLWFYSSAYKRQLIIGNLIVAFISAIPPLLVGLANESMFGGFLESHDLVTIADRLAPAMTLVYAWLGGFAVMIFLYTWIREIIKDMQDQMGDRELECHTIPIVWGELGAKIFVTVLVVIAMALLCWLQFAVLPFPRVWNSMSVRYLVFGLLIPLACVVWLTWAGRISSDYRNAQLLMKFAMFLGMMYSFVIYHYLCA